MAGVVVSVTERQIRARSLPIGKVNLMRPVFDRRSETNSVGASMSNCRPTISGSVRSMTDQDHCRSQRSKSAMTESVIHEPGAEWLIPQDANRNAAGLPAPLLQQRGETIEPSQGKPPRRISLHAIRAVALRIADRFQPEKIILFGSYAYGHPKPESDVDLLVIMDTPLRSRQQRLEISPRSPPVRSRSLSSFAHRRNWQSVSRWAICSYARSPRAARCSMNEIVAECIDVMRVVRALIRPKLGLL